MNYLFAFTLGITILNFIMILSIFFKSNMEFPSYKVFNATAWWFFFPCFFYQVYWWSVFFELI